MDQKYRVRSVVTVILPVSSAVLLGAKRTLMVQEAPAASVRGKDGAQSWLVGKPNEALSVGLTSSAGNAIAVICSGPSPLLRTVTTCSELVVPTVCRSKLIALGVITSWPTGDRPVPESATVSGLDKALLTTLTLAVLLPSLVGLKVTEMVQVASIARLLPQSLV